MSQQGRMVGYESCTTHEPTLASKRLGDGPTLTLVGMERVIRVRLEPCDLLTNPRLVNDRVVAFTKPSFSTSLQGYLESFCDDFAVYVARCRRVIGVFLGMVAASVVPVTMKAWIVWTKAYVSTQNPYMCVCWQRNSASYADLESA